MRTALTLAALACLLAERPVCAQSDCYVRYEHVRESTAEVLGNLPSNADYDLHHVLQVLDAVDTLERFLRLDPAETEPLVCGEPLRSAEALVMVWRERGLLPTPEQKAAAARAAAVKGLNDAIHALQGAK